MKRGVLILSVALVFTACGGGDADDGGDGGESEATTTVMADVGEAGGAGGSGTEADLEAAAVAAFAAFQAGDDQTYFDTYSRRCREELGFVAVASYLDGRRFNIDFGGIDLRALRAGEVMIDGFDGSSAIVAVEIEGTTEPFRESIPTPWVYEEGAWRLGDCSGIEPPPNDLSAEGADPGSAAERGMVADLAGWLIYQSWVTLDDEEIIVEFGGDPAPEGSSLITTGINLTYTGAESAVRLRDQLEFAFVNGQTVYGQDASCETDEYGTEPLAAGPIAPGDDLAPAVVCRVVPESELDGLLLRITHIPTGDERWFRMDPS